MFTELSFGCASHLYRECVSVISGCGIVISPILVELGVEKSHERARLSLLEFSQVANLQF